MSSLQGYQVAQIYAGHYHSFAILTSGKLYGWGENVDYILGALDEDYEERGKKTTTNLITSGGIKKKSNKKNTYYTPIELKVNKNLVVF